MKALVAEETGEILNDAEMDGDLLLAAGPEMLAMASGAPACAGAGWAACVAALLKIGNPEIHKLATGLLAKAKHSQVDQALVDMAHHACDKSMEIDGLPAKEKEHVGKARDHLREAGAVPIEKSTVDPAG